MSGVRWAAALAIGAAVIYAIDRLLLGAEARGWIYWRRRKASPGTASQAFQEVQKLLEPGRRHVLEQQRRVVREEGDEADPPEPESGLGHVASAESSGGAPLPPGAGEGAGVRGAVRSPQNRRQ